MNRRTLLSGICGAAAVLPLAAVGAAVEAPTMPNLFTGAIHTERAVFVYEKGICRAKIGDLDAPEPNLANFIG